MDILSMKTGYVILNYLKTYSFPEKFFFNISKN